MTDKNHEYRLIETVLVNYNFLKDIIENEKVLNNLKGVSFEHTKIESNEKSDPTEKETMRIIKRKEDIQEISNLMMIIENSINNLPQLEKESIELYYVEGKSWNEVANVLSYSSRQCKRKRKSGIHRLSKVCFIPSVKKYYEIIARLCPDYVLLMS